MIHQSSTFERYLASALRLAFLKCAQTVHILVLTLSLLAANKTFADEKEIDLPDVEIEDLPVPQFMNHDCSTVSAVTIKLSAVQSTTGSIEYRIKELIPSDPAAFRILISRIQFNEPNTENRPTDKLAVGDTYQVERVKELDITRIFVHVILQIERSDSKGKPYKTPRLLVSARTEVGGTLKHYQNSDQVTAIKQNGAAVWAFKEKQFEFQTAYRIFSKDSEPVEVVLSPDIAPKFGTPINPKGKPLARAPEGDKAFEIIKTNEPAQNQK